MSRDRVKCRVCSNEDDSFCLIKKCKTKGNKPRICGDFVHDILKVKVKQKIPSTMRPDWYWKRKEVRRAYKKMIEAERLKKSLSESAPKYISPEAQSPDCLASFRSTAGEVNSTEGPADVVSTISGGGHD